MRVDLDLNELMAGRACNDNREPSRRRYPRRGLDRCIFKIEGQVFPVKDWSRCGVLIEADARKFEAGRSFPALLCFRLAENLVEAPVIATAVRSNTHQVGFAFEPVSELTDRLFDAVIEDHLLQALIAAQAAAESQTQPA